MKPYFFLFLSLLFLGTGFSYTVYSYSQVLICGNSTCGPAFYEPPFQGGGGYGGNISNVTNETIVPAGPTGFAITVTTWLNDLTNLLVSFLITEEGPQKIVIGRVVFFAIIVFGVFMALGIFFGYKKVKKYLTPKIR